MTYSNTYLERLYQRSRSGNTTDLAAYQAYRRGMIEQASKTIAHLSLVLEHRNLSMSEAGQIYKASILTSAISTSDIGNNAKRTSIAFYTCHHETCPCCDNTMYSTSSTWFIKAYFIAYGFIRICRTCNARYKNSNQCLPVYYKAFWQAHDTLGNEVAWSIYKPYLQLGMVYNANDRTSVAQANEYMDFYISQIKG